MNKVWVIAKRELKSYFVSPVAYVVIGLFLFISGYFFYIILASSKLAEARGIIMNMSFTFMLISPLITMRLLAEEKKLGTIEFLFTSPIKVAEIVTGKYLAAVILFLIMVVITFQYPLYLIIFGKPDLGPIITSMLGFFLLGATYLAVGVFASSLSENQLISAIVGMIILIFLWVVGWAGDTIGGGVGNFVSSLSLMNNLENLGKGVIDAGNVFYYLAMIFFFLFITVKRLEWKRW